MKYSSLTQRCITNEIILIAKRAKSYFNKFIYIEPFCFRFIRFNFAVANRYDQLLSNPPGPEGSKGSQS